MKTFAIHSPNDAAILIRLHDDLVKAGFESPLQWNMGFYPVENKENSWNKVENYTLLIDDKNQIRYHNHRCDYKHEHRDLTPSNYEAILSEIIESRS